MVGSDVVAWILGILVWMCHETSAIQNKDRSLHRLDDVALERRRQEPDSEHVDMYNGTGEELGTTNDPVMEMWMEGDVFPNRSAAEEPTTTNDLAMEMARDDVIDGIVGEVAKPFFDPATEMASEDVIQDSAGTAPGPLFHPAMEMDTEMEGEDVINDSGGEVPDPFSASAMDMQSTSPDVRFFTHHKTGEMLAIEAIRSCFNFSGLNVEHIGKSWAELLPSDPQMPVIHFVRDPFSLLVSAYNYHRANTTMELWLHSPDHALHALANDEFLLNELGENETYHDFLSRAPIAIGMQAEFNRAFHGELQRMANASRVCLDSPTWCKEVCLEDFVTDSALFNATWASVLQFVNLDPNAVLPQKPSMNYRDCLAQLDLNNENSDVLLKMSDHITQGKMSEEWNLALETEARKLDAEFYDSSLSLIAEAYGCHRNTQAVPELRAVPEASSAEHQEAPLPDDNNTGSW